MKQHQVPESVPTEYQFPTIIAFRRLVRQQRTEDGKVWYPARVLEELWDLWRDRPTGPGEKLSFIERHTQEIGRLRRGVTKSIRSALLFELLESFVAKHAEPGTYVPVGRDIKKLISASEGLNQFAFPGWIQPNWDLSRLFGKPRGKPLQTSPPRMFVLRVPSEGDHRSRPAKDDRSQEAGRYLAVSALDVAYGYCPAVFFGLDWAYLEVGFFLYPLQYAILRTPLALAGQFDDKRFRKAAKSWTSFGSARLLEVLYMDANGQSVVTESSVLLSEMRSRSDEDVIGRSGSYQYEAAVEEDPEIVELAARILNFLDVPRGIG